MKGDYSRFTFDPKKHYSGVLMQQGRVQTDADINEQFEIARHRMETEVKDFIGQSGAPEDNPGFELKCENRNILIGKGHFYVEGMLIENEFDLNFTEQPDLPDEKLPEDDGLYLAYLDVWRRHLTALEASDILDAALGNQDTATRIKNLWQVKLLRLGDNNLGLNDDRIDGFKPGNGWQPAVETGNSDGLPLSEGQLKARVSGTGINLGNQLYRVEIHDPGTSNTATFKWSRENGALAAEVTGINEKKIKVKYIGRGFETGFVSNEWIEVTNDNLELHGKSGVMAQIGESAADESFILKISEKDKTLWYEEIIGGGTAADPERLRKLNTRARRWDSAGAKPVTEGEWIKIENDIEVSFGGKDTPHYKPCDYWLIPSRGMMRNIYWERDSNEAPLFQPAHGVYHYYTCLALMDLSESVWKKKGDIRVTFRNLVGGLLNKQGDTVEGDFAVKGTFSLNKGVEINEFSDDVDLGDGSKSALPTQNAVKSYADSVKIAVKSDMDSQDADIKAYVDSKIEEAKIAIKASAEIEKFIGFSL